MNVVHLWTTNFCHSPFICVVEEHKKQKEENGILTIDAQQFCPTDDLEEEFGQ